MPSRHKAPSQKAKVQQAGQGKPLASILEPLESTEAVPSATKCASSSVTSPMSALSCSCTALSRLSLLEVRVVTRNVRSREARALKASEVTTMQFGLRDVVACARRHAAAAWRGKSLPRTSTHVQTMLTVLQRLSCPERCKRFQCM